MTDKEMVLYLLNKAKADIYEVVEEDFIYCSNPWGYEDLYFEFTQNDELIIDEKA